MIRFEDGTGEVHTLRLTVGAVETFTAQTGVDLLASLHHGNDEARHAVFGGGSGLLQILLRLAGAECVSAWPSGDEMRAAGWHLLADFVWLPGYRDDEHADKSTEDATETEPEPLTLAGIYVEAGIAGIDPRPHTYGEVKRLAEGAQRARWAQSSAIMAEIRNGNVTREGMVEHDHFDPYAAKDSGESRDEYRERCAAAQTHALFSIMTEAARQREEEQHGAAD